ncbi:hypothetical protein LILAB_10285 [Corallococcus macrosporus]|uniref:Uncharacterized protein n=1 Tax=Myxococcus fulvus (strain ATCC BAA-855 / HW-1) TaxID=483219 RepID=F8CMA1_MYXFH|nr:hypothetical protein LILAB_10285 [Corallococcus macrosporus]
MGNERLFGFLLDEDGSPWALLGDDVVRPQQVLPRAASE